MRDKTVKWSFMFFNQVIRQTLIEVLRFYNEAPRMVFKPHVQNEFTDRCVSKLKNFSFATVFTRQEYTFMYTALCFFADVAYDTVEDLGFDPEPLIDRLAELSGLQL